MQIFFAFTPYRTKHGLNSVPLTRQRHASQPHGWLWLTGCHRRQSVPNFQTSNRNIYIAKQKKFTRPTDVHCGRSTDVQMWFWRAQGEILAPASSRPAMVPLVAPLFSLETLSMCCSTCRSVDFRWYGKPFDKILVWLYAGVDIGDTFWCHSLPGGDVDFSSHLCARRRFLWKWKGKQLMIRTSNF